MGDLVVFSQHRGTERVWVPKAEEDYWIRSFGRMGIAAARLRDYREWGSQFYRPTDPADLIMLRPKVRRGRT